MFTKLVMAAFAMTLASGTVYAQSYAAEMQKRGMCLGKTDQDPKDYAWHQCTNGSIHANGVIGKTSTDSQMTLKQERDAANQDLGEIFKKSGFCKGYFDIDTKAAEALELGGSVSREEARRFLKQLPASVNMGMAMMGQQMVVAGGLALALGGKVMSPSEAADLFAQATKEGTRAGNRDYEKEVVYRHYKECSADFSPAPPTAEEKAAAQVRLVEKIKTLGQTCEKDFRAQNSAAKIVEIIGRHHLQNEVGTFLANHGGAHEEVVHACVELIAKSPEGEAAKARYIADAIAYIKQGINDNYANPAVGDPVVTRIRMHDSTTLVVRVTASDRGAAGVGIVAEIEKSSGDATIDRAMLNLVRNNAMMLGNPPDSLTYSVPLTFTPKYRVDGTKR